VIEEREEVVVPETDLKTQDESDSKKVQTRLGVDMPSSTIPTRRKSRWLTQTLQEAQEHVGVPRSPVTASIPPRRYVSHVALVSSICEASSYLEEERCDVLTEEWFGRQRLIP
jgi:hypothetical protein